MNFKGLLLIATCWSSVAFAVGIGGVDGGGGVGVRCPAGSGAPKNFELLDLQEARINGLVVTQNPQSLDTAANLVADLLGVHNWVPDDAPLGDLETSYLGIIQPILSEQSYQGLNIQIVGNLPLSTDIGTYQILPGCQLEQVAYFDDTTSTLSIAANWDDLDWLDRAALVTHELTYLAERQKALEYYAVGGNMTSVRARAFVGQLFSTSSVDPLAASIPSSGYANCASGNNDPNPTGFFAWDDGAGNVTATFETIIGYDSLYQMKASFVGVSLSQLLQNGSAGGVNVSAPLQFMNEPDAPSFIVQITMSQQNRLQFQLFEVQSTGPAPVSPTQMFSCYVPTPVTGAP
jgi:hypothetical protein